MLLRTSNNSKIVKWFLPAICPWNKSWFNPFKIKRQEWEEIRVQVFLNVTANRSHCSCSCIPSLPLPPHHPVSFLSLHYHYWRNFTNTHFLVQVVTSERAGLGILSSVRDATKQTEVPTRRSQGCPQRLKWDGIQLQEGWVSFPAEGSGKTGMKVTQLVCSLSEHPNPSPIFSLCEISAGGIQSVWQRLFE